MADRCARPRDLGWFCQEEEGQGREGQESLAYTNTIEFFRNPMRACSVSLFGHHMFAVVVGFFYAVLHETKCQQWQKHFTSVVGREKDHEFFRLATTHYTDKVTKHDYDYLYSKYLAPVRNESLRLLEIGLGCDMGYGPGHSLKARLSTSINVLGNF